MIFKADIGAERKKELQAELERILPAIINCGVEKVVLFGSLVSGNTHKCSDIDLLIVKKTGRTNSLKPQIAVARWIS